MPSARRGISGPSGPPAIAVAQGTTVVIARRPRSCRISDGESTALTGRPVGRAGLSVQGDRPQTRSVVGSLSDHWRPRWSVTLCPWPAPSLAVPAAEILHCRSTGLAQPRGRHRRATPVMPPIRCSPLLSIWPLFLDFGIDGRQAEVAEKGRFDEALEAK